MVGCSSSNSETGSKNNDATTTKKYDPRVRKILKKKTCLGCHTLDKKLKGPSFMDISKKGYSQAEMVELIRNPVQENWPDYPPMTPIDISDKEGKIIYDWISGLAKADSTK
ncbi:MAG: hypothetical protein H6607_10230 [Flavobacteriales bacterium]|nr:hypothetical protein [Flavobacteriales bacterium]